MKRKRSAEDGEERDKARKKGLFQSLMKKSSN
jgi:hypothetical protein